MRTHCFAAIRILLILFLGLPFVGCEDDDGRESTQAEAQAEAENVQDAELFGRWVGVSGTGQVDTTLEIQGPALGTDVYGTLKWPGGDVRTVHGWYPYGPGSESIYPSPKSAIDARLEITTSGAPDLWDLHIHGNTMTGVGRKSDGRTYDVRLTKT